MSIRTKIKYVLLALIALVLMGTVSAEASGYNWFETLPKTSAKTSKKKPKILFVGNSHTFKNDVPELFRNLCSKQGISPQIETVTKGGHSLYEYMYPDSADPEEAELSQRLMQLLKTQKWDFVVLQDRSYEAVLHPGKMKKAVSGLHTLIEQAGAKMVLYMTWAPKKSHYIYKYTDKKASNPNEFQEKVKEMYYLLADKYNAALAPTGIAFRRAQKILPDIQLYGEDGLHSSPAGAYLSACVMYATIFGKSPEGIACYPASLGNAAGGSAHIAAKLQALAADVTVRGNVENTARIRFASELVTVQGGKSVKLEYQILSAAEGSRVTSFSSSNRLVATVDEHGNVTGRRAGTAVITARLNNNKTASCTVEVKKGKGTQTFVEAKKIWLKNAASRIRIKKGHSKLLKAAFSPRNVSTQKLQWSSSNGKVAKVSAEGKLTAVGKGTAIITGTTTDGSKLQVKIKVKVG